MLSGSFRESVKRTISIIAPADTSHSIIYAGYGSATPNVLGGKVKLLLQTTSLVYQAIYEIKWFFYMIMNKLYYVVGLVLLLLFALTKEDSKILRYANNDVIPSPKDLCTWKRSCKLRKNYVYYKAMIPIISQTVLRKHVG